MLLLDWNQHCIYRPVFKSCGFPCTLNTNEVKNRKSLVLNVLGDQRQADSSGHYKLSFILAPDWLIDWNATGCNDCPSLSMCLSTYTLCNTFLSNCRIVFLLLLLGVCAGATLRLLQPGWEWACASSEGQKYTAIEGEAKQNGSIIAVLK